MRIPEVDLVAFTDAGAPEADRAAAAAALDKAATEVCPGNTFSARSWCNLVTSRTKHLVFWGAAVSRDFGATG